MSTLTPAVVSGEESGLILNKIHKILSNGEEMPISCTEGVINWNEKSYDTFANIVELIAREKVVKVYLENKDKNVILRSISDCRNILGEETEYSIMKYSTITKEEYIEIIDKFILSDSMKEHLFKQELCRSQLLSIIQLSPVSIYEKRKYLYMLAEHECWFFEVLDRIESLIERQEKTKNIREDDVTINTAIGDKYIDSFFVQYHMVNGAIEALDNKPGEIFNLKECWYDFDIKEQKEIGTMLFMDFDKAMEYIKNDIEESKNNKDTCGENLELDEMSCQNSEIDETLYCWYKLEKWVPNAKNYMENKYDYVLINDEICYFTCRFFLNKLKDGYDRWPITNLDFAVTTFISNLTVPFQAGDIVTIDCSPFMPKKRVLVIENRDCGAWSDWCALQAIYQNEEGYWETGNVKGGVFLSYLWWEFISPLYRLEKYIGELTEEEQIYQEVQNYLQGEEQKGEELWNAMNDRSLGGNMGKITTEKLREIINSGR